MQYLGSHKGHINDGYVGSGLRFQAAVNKHGKNSFDRIIVDFCYSDIELKQKEQFYLDHYNCACSKSFYNISHSATGGNMGQDYTKISERMRKNNPNFGGKQRREYNKIHGAPNKGYKHSKETVELIRNRMKGNKNPNKDGSVRRTETWLVNIETGELLKYDSLKLAEESHNASHAAVHYHRKNKTNEYRGYKWYVGKEISEIKLNF